MAGNAVSDSGMGAAPTPRIEVLLTPVEQRLVRYVGAQRQEQNERARVQDRKVCKDRDSTALHTDAFGAELACSRLLNVYPDLTVNPRSGGADLRLVDGRRLDVKQTSHESGRLLASCHKRATDSELHVLMIGTLPLYRFAGWTDTKNLIRDENICNLPYGPCYALAQERLNREPPQPQLDDSSSAVEELETIFFESIESETVAARAWAHYSEIVSSKTTSGKRPLDAAREALDEVKRMVKRGDLN
jgi:hypothetical protein